MSILTAFIFKVELDRDTETETEKERKRKGEKETEKETNCPVYQPNQATLWHSWDELFLKNITHDWNTLFLSHFDWFLQMHNSKGLQQKRKCVLIPLRNMNTSITD